MDMRDLIPWGHRSGTPARGDEDHPLAAMQREMNRMFEDFWRRFEQPGAGFGGVALSSPKTGRSGQRSAMARAC